SMIEIGMNSGDIIIARKTNVANNGQIVVALIGDEATVKEFHKEKGHFRLQPYNSSMEPIVVDKVDILGIVVSLVRNYE
ncbi:MAG: S24 family peptidase, partial [Oscillospiraceae bacterium]